MKKALTLVLIVALSLSMVSACGKISETTSSLPSTDGSVSSVESTTVAPEETPGEKFFKKNEDVQTPYYSKLDLDYSTKEYPDYECYGLTSMVEQNGHFYSLVDIADEKGNKPTKTHIFEFDHEGNQLNYFVVNEVDKGYHYLLSDGDKVLLIACEPYHSNGDARTSWVYDYDLENQKGELLFELTCPRDNYVGFDSFVNGRLYIWTTVDISSLSFAYQGYDLQGNLVCETDPIDFGNEKVDYYSYTNGYAFDTTKESWYYANGFWRGDTFCVITSEEGEGNVEITLFDADLNQIDAFPATLDAGLKFFAGDCSKEYIGDENGLYCWDKQSQLWSPILCWEESYWGKEWFEVILPDLTPNVISGEYVLYGDSLYVPSEKNEQDNEAIVLFSASSNLYSAPSMYYYDGEMMIREKTYSSYRIDKYGKIQEVSDPVEAMADDFRNGRLDVIFMDGIALNLQIDLKITNRLDVISQLQNEGCCLDLTSYIQPENGEQSYLSYYPVELYQLYNRGNGIYVIPTQGLYADTLFCYGKSPFDSESTYSDWLEYGVSQSTEKKLVMYDQNDFLKKCLSYDLYSFIDINNMMAQFDCQEFRDLLTLCKEYCGMPESDITNPFDYAYTADQNTVDAGWRSGWEHDISSTGYPSANGTGYSLLANSMAVISAYCEYPEEILSRIDNYYKGWEHNLMTYSKIDPITGVWNGKWRGGSKLKWSSIAHAYYTDQELIDIVVAEAKKYFDDTQSLDDTIDAINKNVQEVLDRRGN